MQITAHYLNAVRRVFMGPALRRVRRLADEARAADVAGTSTVAVDRAMRGYLVASRQLDGTLARLYIGYFRDVEARHLNRLPGSTLKTERFKARLADWRADTRPATAGRRLSRGGTFVGDGAY